MGFPERLLSDDESIVLEMRAHVKALIVPVLALVVVGAVAVALIVVVPEESWQPWARLAVAVVAVLIVLRVAGWPFLVWWTTTHTVTDRRLILRSGVLNRSGHDMPLARITDVSFEQRLIERVLRCGTLVVESAGDRGAITLQDIPHVEVVQRTIYGLVDDLNPDPRDARDPRDDAPARRLPE